MRKGLKIVGGIALLAGGLAGAQAVPNPDLAFAAMTNRIAKASSANPETNSPPEVSFEPYGPPAPPLPPISAVAERALEGGAVAFDERRYADAFAIFEALKAKNPHPQVQDWCDLYLGWMHADGLGTPRNGQRALEYLDRAAIQGMGQARYKLGRLAIEGKIFPKNVRIGVQQMHESARMGFGLAAYVLGEMSKEGIFRTPDFLFAYRNFQQAIHTIEPAMGPAKAEILFAHGNLLVTGLAGVTNRDQGLVLLGQSARMGHLHAAYRLWRIHTNGEGGEKDFEAANFWYRYVMEEEARHGPENRVVAQMKAEHLDRVDPDFIAKMEARAEEGDWRAMRELGTAFEEGVLAKASVAKALAWYAQAAEKGDVYSSFRLAEILFYRSPRLGDKKLANEWYRAVARAGEVGALFRLAENYFNGAGIRQDHARAFSLFQQVLARGDARPLRYLAVMYTEGLGVRPNLAQANEMFLRMSSMGDVEARYQSGLYLVRQENPVLVEQGLTNLKLAAEAGHVFAQLDYVLGKAKELPRPAPDEVVDEWHPWLLRAIENGHPAGIYRAGWLALHGYRPLSPKREQALLKKYDRKGDHPVWTWFWGEWLWASGDEKVAGIALEKIEAAAGAGVADACYFLSRAYAEGWAPVQQDRVLAAEWEVKAAEAGHADARTDLGYKALFGTEDAPPDYLTAERWIRLGVVSGSLRARFLLGYLYEHGFGVKQDYRQAARWYLDAAARGHDAAQYKAGLFKESEAKRDPVERIAFLKEALRWYELAAEQGFAPAVDELARVKKLLPPPKPEPEPAPDPGEAAVEPVEAGAVSAPPEAEPAPEEAVK